MLELRNINFSVRGSNGERKEILKDITLTIGSGEFVVITGPNGSGKSTLAKIIMGMEKPSQGQVVLDGKNITDLPVNERAKLGIGFAFQKPIRFKGMLVSDLLSYAADRTLTAKEACDYLSRVGLCAVDYVSRELDGSLSGGEMKRVEIAMLMARNVKLSVFDEPEAGIDLWSFHNLIDIFKHLQEESNSSIIVISHQERILEIADRIVVIDEGEIADEGSQTEILPKLLDGIDGCDFYAKEGLR